jgi:hypothetical protein
MKSILESYQQFVHLSLISTKASLHTLSVLRRRRRFDNERLVKVQRKIFLDMVAAFGLDETDFDVWTEDGPDRIVQVRAIIYYKYLCGKCEVLLENVQNLIDHETLRIASAILSKPRMVFTGEDLRGFFHEFRTYEETKSWYKELAKTYPSHAIFVETIGKTVEGRDIFALKLGNRRVHGKKAVFVHGLQHAREWISGSTVNYIAFKLLSEMAPKVSAVLSSGAHPTEEARPLCGASLLDLVEIIVVPIMNPDGYHYTWTSNRLWRKNRSKNVPFGRGVDLNRNWGEHWGGPGTSSNPVSDIYRGSKAASTTRPRRERVR